MEEDIKTLEEKIENMKTGKDVYRANNYIDLANNMEKEIQALENLINRNRELEKRNIYLVNERKKLEELLFMSNENYIEKSKVKEIRDKAEVMDYYTLPDVIEDLNKLLGEEE